MIPHFTYASKGKIATFIQTGLVWMKKMRSERKNICLYSVEHEIQFIKLWLNSLRSSSIVHTTIDWVHATRSLFKSTGQHNRTNVRKTAIMSSMDV